MNITEEEKQQIKDLHNQQFLLKEEKINSIASIGSGFVNKQGNSGRIGKFINHNSEEDPMEENLVGYYDFGETGLEGQGINLDISDLDEFDEEIN
jgi:hypothetical protein